MTATLTTTSPTTAPPSTSTDTDTQHTRGTTLGLGSRTPTRRRRTRKPQPRTDTSRPPLGSPPALQPWVAVDRRLVLVDIENLVGGSGASALRVAQALARLRIVIDGTDADIWHVACGRRLLSTAMSVLPQPVLLGTGIDGADQRLLERMHPQLVAGHYASVALASADTAAFAGAVTMLAEAGVPTDLYIGAGHLGHALARVARSITDIGPLLLDAA